METVIVPAEKYLELVNDSLLLSLLEAYGVDNWSGYSEAYMEYAKEIGEAD